MMRFDKIWTVARKDISEFRTNRYIMFSLALMPMLMAIFLPVIYLLPITSFAPDNPTTPIDLNLDPTVTIQGQELNNVTLNNTRLVDCIITSGVLYRCEVEACNMSIVAATSSFMGNSTGIEMVIVHSNLLNTTLTRASVSDSVMIGEESETTQMLKTFIDALLFFYILIPAILPTIIASYSFVGEKTNRSLEPLLATPTTDLELLMGKGLSIFVPTMAVTWLSLIPFVIIVDLITQPLLGYYPLPSLIWALGVFVLAPMICLLAIFANVIVSSRVSDVRASQQIGSLIVLPIVVFFLVVLLGLVSLDALNMLLFIGVVGAAVVAIIYVATKVFKREEILIRWK
jgi:ABC-2 type transport system permease protein